MDIFESLESLSVSEKCFGDIVTMVEAMLNEDIFSAIKQKYPESKDVLRKVELTKKACENQRKERNAAIEREYSFRDLGNTPYKVYAKRNLRGKKDIYRNPFDQLKLNREQSKQRVMKTLEKGKRNTDEFVKKMEKLGKQLERKSELAKYLEQIKQEKSSKN